MVGCHAVRQKCHISNAKWIIAATVKPDAIVRFGVFVSQWAG